MLRSSFRFIQNQSTSCHVHVCILLRTWTERRSDLLSQECYLQTMPTKKNPASRVDSSHQHKISFLHISKEFILNFYCVYRITKTRHPGWTLLISTKYRLYTSLNFFLCIIKNNRKSGIKSGLFFHQYKIFLDIFTLSFCLM